MMVGKEDLGLSLSLSFPEISRNSASATPLPHLNNPLPAHPSPLNLFHKPPWGPESFPSSDRNSETCRAETRTLLKGIDVNRAPAATDVEEEAGVSSPNSTISSVSGKRELNITMNPEENYVKRACSRGISDEEDGETSRQKLRLTKDQSVVLEESFKEHNTLNPVSSQTYTYPAAFSSSSPTGPACPFRTKPGHSPTGSACALAFFKNPT
ncbi:PREDICTED: homeobox-leucine zipper protein HAT4-like [Ipomoea nil]|uniref:homeobox-leucine zipper protein HAT4-like n=1 Tax=Ipomoea nil TaxID=35883 RepID=UPI000900B5AE|nr:PREDICTED: homeobox-leucine zipper protein HAT4-like [Ipomoea nil]